MKTNKLTAAVLAAMTLAGSVVGGAAASAGGKVEIKSIDMPIQLLYNARQLPSDVQPEVANGTTLVPLRVVSEKLGAKLTLTGKKISIVKGKSTLALTIGASTATINGKTTQLPIPVKVTKGRTLVPLRVVSEALGVAVDYDPDLRFVWIGSKDVPELNDIVRPSEFSLYRSYYKGGPSQIMDGGFGLYTNATIVEAKDFPYKSGTHIYYRFDLAYDKDNNVYMRSVEETQSTMNPRYYLLSKNTTPTYSTPLYYLLQMPRKGLHIFYNDTSKLGGKFSDFQKVEYIDGGHTIGLGGSKSSEVLIKNPWRKQ